MSGRPVLTYALQGLASREVTLFKSFARLIDHLTQHHWEWREAGADVLVLAQGVPVAPGTPAIFLCHAAPPLAVDHLALPLRAHELEACLNAIGQRVAAQRAQRAAASPTDLGDDNTVAELLRWPPAVLLNHPDHLRLATLMTGRAMSLATVRQRSGVAAPVCSAFMQQLWHAGLLRVAPVQPRARKAPAVAPPGLLARIRQRLGLAAGAKA